MGGVKGIAQLPHPFAPLGKRAKTQLAHQGDFLVSQTTGPDVPGLFPQQAEMDAFLQTFRPSPLPEYRLLVQKLPKLLPIGAAKGPQGQA